MFPPDAEERINYCRWLQESVYDGMVDPGLTFYIDVVWFHLSGYMNSQKNSYWSADNPRPIQEVPLYDAKIGARWRSVSPCSDRERFLARVYKS
jgi:hypothetical protein